MPSSPAICLLSSPATTSAITSRSRGVNERYRRRSASTLRPLLARVAVACERLLNGVEQLLVAEGLGQKLHGPGFHRLHGHRDIAVAGDEDNGHGHVARRQPLLQLQPAEARQPHIEHQAAGHIRARAAQELLRRREGLDPQPHRPQEVLEGLAHRRIIIDDEYQGLGVHHATPSLPIGTVNCTTAPCGTLRGRPQPAAVRLDNPAADRQPHAQAVRLGRIEGVEQPVETLRLEPRARIAHRNQHRRRGHGLRAHPQRARPRAAATHGFDGVHHQIEQHLLQLDAVAQNPRHLLGEVRL